MVLAAGVSNKLSADILGAGRRLVQLQELEPAAVSPLVDKMVTDGIACGGSVDDATTLDGAVVIGQLAMTRGEWDVLAFVPAFASDFADAW